MSPSPALGDEDQWLWDFFPDVNPITAYPASDGSVPMEVAGPHPGDFDAPVVAGPPAPDPRPTVAATSPSPAASTPAGDVARRQLVCPFYAADPSTHAKCANKTFRFECRLRSVVSSFSCFTSTVRPLLLTLQYLPICISLQNAYLHAHTPVLLQELRC